MCLRTIEKQLMPDNRTKTGYKVFRITNRRGVHFEFDNSGNDTCGPLVRKNRWLKARQESIYYDVDHEYTTGFHIFTNKRDAKLWAKGCGSEIVYKIWYRKARILGTQYYNSRSLSVVVADEMFVPGG